MNKSRTCTLCIMLIAAFLFCGLFTAAMAAPQPQISSVGSSDYRTEFYSNGDKYTGYFLNGKYQGQGKYTWSNGDYYEGEFSNGQISGTGRIVFANGEFWEGLFSAGQINSGYGTFYWGNSGDKFKGSWLNGQPDGLGTLIHANGLTEQVTFKQGVLSSNTTSYPSTGSQSQWSPSSAGSPKVYPAFQGLAAGGTVSFGSFEQDGNYYNGKEPIIWKVLMIYDGRALLLSQNLLEAMPYNYAQVSVTWEGSTIRNWLNSTFYNDAFSNEEKSCISQNWNSNPANSAYGTMGGSNTFDNVFLLSMDELIYYFPSEASRKAMPTQVARSHGAYGTADVNCAWWWLRSPGQNTACATSVNSIGVLLNTGPLVNDSTGGIRPAIWVNLGY